MRNFIIFLLVLVTGSATGQTHVSFEKKEMIAGGDTLRYRVQYPLHYDAAKKYPLVLLLHGAGERGWDNEKQLVWGASLFEDSANRIKFPAIMLFPQCAPDDFWSRMEGRAGDSLRFLFRSDLPMGKGLTLVSKLLDDLVAAGKVDTKRIYVGGLSMGGMGTFEILWRKPKFFAAAFPICGGGDPAKATVYGKNFPIWIFHGGSDPVVPPANSRLMVKALTAAKAKVKYSEYPGVQHDSWRNAFAEPELLPWLFAQKK